MRQAIACFLVFSYNKAGWTNLLYKPPFGQGSKEMEFIKKLIPEALLKAVRPFYHGLMAYVASWYFDYPSRKMIVIGVTGTAGKSTTVQMLARILNYHPSLNPSPSRGGEENRKCGFITTVSFYDGEEEYINKHGLSMPGGWLLQKQLAAMFQKGCGYAVVECTSEGLAQNRHLGIEFEGAVFTNLSEAHVEAHGGFKNYRKAKGKLFAALKPGAFIVANGDDDNAEYFLSFPASRKLSVGEKPKKPNEDIEILKLENLNVVEHSFILSGTRFEVKLLGAFNLQNAALAASAASALGVPFFVSSQILASFTKIRGRMEAVENTLGITIIVDYGCEPASFKAALESVSNLPHRKIIHVFGSTGGHRDKRKRFIFGELSAKYSNYIIVTNDDVYESNPEEISSNIVHGISRGAKGVGYEVVLDRREAIARALKVAQRGDIILLSGKGSEQFLVLPENRKIEWDEVRVVQEELNN